MFFRVPYTHGSTRRLYDLFLLERLGRSKTDDLRFINNESEGYFIGRDIVFIFSFFKNSKPAVVVMVVC